MQFPGHYILYPNHAYFDAEVHMVVDWVTLHTFFFLNGGNITHLQGIECWLLFIGLWKKLAVARSSIKAY